MTPVGTVPDNFPGNYNAIEAATPDVIDELLNVYEGTTDGPRKASYQVSGHDFFLDRNIQVDSWTKNPFDGFKSYLDLDIQKFNEDLGIEYRFHTKVVFSVE